MKGENDMLWNMRHLENSVRARHGNIVAERLHVPADSIAWKIEMGYYHACESIRVLKDAIYDSRVISQNDHESIAAAKAILLSATKSPDAPPLNVARYQAEAHMIAAAQSLHSTADIMASVVFWALNFPIQPKAPVEHKLNLYRVRKFLQGDVIYRSIVDAISEVLDLHQFQYLAAYVNTTKHRSLIEVQYTAHIDPKSNPRQGLKIKGFQYLDAQGNLNSYDGPWGEEFLFAEAQVVRNGILAIGNSLNRFYGITV